MHSDAAFFLALLLYIKEFSLTDPRICASDCNCFVNIIHTFFLRGVILSCNWIITRHVPFCCLLQR